MRSGAASAAPYGGRPRPGRHIALAALIAATAALLVVPARVAADDVHEAVRRLLVEPFGFSRGDIAAVSRGVVAARTLDVADDREVSAVGAIRIDAPPEFYAEQLRDIVRFKRHEAVRQIGLFGRSAAAGDLAGLTLDAGHLQALRTCTPDACDINLSAAAIAEARRVIPWGTPQAVATAQAWFRDTLAGMVREYQTSGARALMTYVNGHHTLSMPDEFRALVSSPPAVLDIFPTVRAHMTEYPRGASAAIEDRIYWSKEKIGPEMVISVTHMALARVPAAAAPVAYVAASRQLYGSQLFDASLGLTMLVRDPASDGRMYLIYANRSRVDAIGGFFGPIKRAFVRSRARAALGPTLERAKKSVEQRFAQQGSGE